jgi:hypothetical protein
LSDRPALIAVVLLVVAVAATALADGVFTPAPAPGATTSAPQRPAAPAECEGAVAGRCRNIDFMIRSVVIKPVDPGFQGSVIDAGRAHGTLGQGLTSITATFPRPQECQPSGCPFLATVQGYFPAGGLRGSIVGIDKLHPDGSASGEGDGKWRSGTYGLRGAHGVFRFRSRTPKGSHVTTVQVRGVLVSGKAG